MQLPALSFSLITSDSATAMNFDHVCLICASPFLIDTPKVSQAVAIRCGTSICGTYARLLCSHSGDIGHVYHRDCVERLITTEHHPKCCECDSKIPSQLSLLVPLFLAYDEDEYDKAIKDTVDL